MLNNLNILFLIMTLLGIMISFSSLNWFTAWMGLEINMISFIPFFLSNKNILSTESAMNYFLIQASASSMFLFFCIFNSMNNFTHILFMDLLQNFLIIVPLMMKLGSAPFHSWFIIVMQGLDWISSYALMTLQKLAPLFILAFFIDSKTILFFSLMSVVAGSIGGLNQLFLKKIFAFSSINHLGWMMISMNLNKSILINYFLLYMLMNLFAISFMQETLISHLKQSTSVIDLLNWTIGILSLGGLPPFLGFLPKWMVIQSLITNNFFILPLVLITTALITLIYYLRLIYSSLLMTSFNQKWNMNYFKNSFFKLNLVVVSSLGLICFNLLLT